MLKNQNTNKQKMRELILQDSLERISKGIDKKAQETLNIAL